MLVLLNAKEGKQIYMRKGCFSLVSAADPFIQLGGP